MMLSAYREKTPHMRMTKEQSRICPNCDCHIVARLHRNFAEKMITRKRKYRCAGCKSEFFSKHGTRG